MLSDRILYTINPINPINPTTPQVNVAGQDFVLHKRYSPKRKVGSGAYGMVVAAVDEQTGKNVAIKKVSWARWGRGRG